MTYILDTHALVWYLENNVKLPPRVSVILSSADSEIVIPSIVLVEVWHLSTASELEHHRLPSDPRFSPLQIARYIRLMRQS
jgi:PIN domain nuclease of toxin-antitoxin system